MPPSSLSSHSSMPCSRRCDLKASLLASLVDNVAVPEILRWLAQLHSEGRVVTEAEIAAKVGHTLDSGDASGRAFLEKVKSW